MTAVLVHERDRLSTGHEGDDRETSRAGEPRRAPRWTPIADRPLSAWMCLGLLVTTMFAGQAGFFGLPLAPHRIFLVLTLVALFNERVGRMRRPQPRGVHLFMAATVLWATCSAIAAGTLHTSLGLFALLDRLVIPYVCFVLAPAVFRTERDRDLLLRCLVLIGLYLGVTAYLEVIGPRSLVYPGFINDPSLGIHYGRARGPFLSAEPDGLVMLTCAFASWYAMFRLRHGWRLLALAGCVVCSLGCLLTLTRSIWLGFVVAFLVAGIRDARIRRWLPIAALVLGAGLLGALSQFPAMKAAVHARAATEGSLYDRASTNGAAVRMIEQHPVTGVGWVRFIDRNQDYVRQGDDLPIGYTHIEAHNVVLGRAAELGLPGAALWLISVALGPGRTVFRRRPDVRLGPVARVLGPAEPAGWGTIAAATTCGWAVTLMLSPVPYPLPNLLVWFLAGLWASTGRPSGRPS